MTEVVSTKIAGPGITLPREVVFNHLAAGEEHHVLMAGARRREGLVGIVVGEFEPALRSEHDRGDGAAEVEFEAMRLAVRLDRDKAGPLDAAATQHAFRLDAIEDRPGRRGRGGAGQRGEQEEREPSQRIEGPTI